jgi:broad specificity phosphatase PhoE
VTTLYLVRHALHDLVGKALAGRAPGLALSSEGRVQALRLGQRFAGVPIGRILSSPVQRAQETAAAIAQHQGGTVDTADELTEIDCGAWTGRSFDSLAADPLWQAWNAERAGATIPDGEGMEAVQARVSRLLARLVEDEPGPVLLVSHSDVIKAMVALVIEMSLNLHDRLCVDPASITTIEMWGPRAGKIVRLNEILAP